MGHNEALVALLDRREEGVVRHREIRAVGIPAVAVRRCVENGLIERVADPLTGLVLGYVLPGRSVDLRHARLAAMAARYPNGVFCMRSALAWHDLSDDMTEGETVAVRRGSWTRAEHPDLSTVIWGDGAPFRTGILSITPAGIHAQITDAPRTVLDCLVSKEFPRDDAIKAMLSLVERDGVAMLDRIYDYAVDLRVADQVEDITTIARKLPCAT